MTHDGIIDEDIWHEAQTKLSEQAAKPRGHTKASHDNILKGLLFDNNGVAYSPVFSKKGNKAYRYYISQNTLSDNNHPDAIIQSIPAHTLEAKIITSLKAEISVSENLSRLFEDNNDLNDYIAKQANFLNYEDIITSCINKVIIMNDSLEIHLNVQTLKSYLEGALKIQIEGITCDMHIISSDFKLQKSYRGALIEKPDGDKSDPLDLPPQQLKNLVRGVVWRDEHFNGLSMKNIAIREGVSKAHVGQVIIRSMDILMAM